MRVIGVILMLAFAAPARAAEPAPPEPAPPELAPIDFPPPVRLERAQVCYRVDDLVCAGEELMAARARQGELDTPGRVELERLTAAVALARGDLAGAGRALDALLALEPAWTAPESASVTFEEALAAARRRADLTAPRLSALPLPDQVQAGRPLTIGVSAEDPAGVARVVLHVAMADGTVVDLAMRLAPEGDWRATVPAELVVVPEVRLWVEAWDSLGNGPSRWGERDAPRRVGVVPVEEEGGLASKWWFWTAIGAGVAATGVILAVALSDGGAAPTGQPGTLTLIPETP